MTQPFQQLLVWQRAHRLTVDVYRASQRISPRTFPTLASQLRRASSSIPSNIAEGCGHQGNREFARFLQISMASATELEYHLILAEDLEALAHLTARRLRSEVTQIKRMLTVLIARVRGAGENEN